MNEYFTPTSVPSNSNAQTSNTRGKQTAPRLRCAIYTRKSTEEGLDQDFNSLDAQREACAAYVVSQASLGWKLIPSHYDDGGISGGTMERPALQRLLTDIQNGQIDIIVVYKIDRLTRSLMDFAKMVDVFDEHSISFVSVTQQFNTTTSMGRLTLNVLLSFAQFEREVTAERIKDKIAASKKKGMWMGGLVPLGYKAEDKKLIINKEEAKTVESLFEQYIVLGSVRKLAVSAEKSGLGSREYRQKNGVIKHSKPFSRGNLYHLLSNPVYIGKTRHQDQIYDGLHEPIITEETWNTVQTLMAENTRTRKSPTNESSPHLLKGLVFDETDDRLTTVHANKKGRKYHYYVSSRLAAVSKQSANGEATKTRKSNRNGWRIPARQLDIPVLETIRKTLVDPLKLSEIIPIQKCSIHEQESQFENAKNIREKLESGDTRNIQSILNVILQKVVIEPTNIKIEINITKLKNLLNDRQEERETNTVDDEFFNSFNLEAESEMENESANTHLIEIKHEIAKRGVEAKLVLNNPEARTHNPDTTLIDIIANAHLWHSKLTDGSADSIHDLSKQLNHDPSEISRFLPLAFLAPDIIEGILTGTQPVDLTQEKLRRLPTLPILWSDQRELLGFAI